MRPADCRNQGPSSFLELGNAGHSHDLRWGTMQIASKAGELERSAGAHSTRLRPFCYCYLCYCSCIAASSMSMLTSLSAAHRCNYCHYSYMYTSYRERINTAIIATTYPATAASATLTTSITCTITMAITIMIATTCVATTVGIVALCSVFYYPLLLL